MDWKVRIEPNFRPLSDRQNVRLEFFYKNHLVTIVRRRLSWGEKEIDNKVVYKEHFEEYYRIDEGMNTNCDSIQECFDEAIKEIDEFYEPDSPQTLTLVENEPLATKSDDDADFTDDGVDIDDGPIPF